MARENDAARPRISSWRSARPSSEIITCNGNVARPPLAELDDALGQEAVRRDVDQCRTQRRRGRFRDLRQVAPDERLVARDPDDVHPRQRRKDPLHLVERQVSGVVLSPGVAHDAARVAREGDGVGEHAWQRRPFEMPVDHRAHDARPTQQRRHTSATSGETVAGRNGASAASAAPLPFMRSESIRAAVVFLGDPGKSRSYASRRFRCRPSPPSPRARGSGRESAAPGLPGSGTPGSACGSTALRRATGCPRSSRGNRPMPRSSTKRCSSIARNRRFARAGSGTEPVAANLAPGCDERVQQLALRRRRAARRPRCGCRARAPRRGRTGAVSGPTQRTRRSSTRSRGKKNEETIVARCPPYMQSTTRPIHSPRARSNGGRCERSATLRKCWWSRLRTARPRGARRAATPARVGDS